MRTLIVVSGGDAPGINTFITRYVALEQASGARVYGAQGGFAGVLDGAVEPLNLRQVAPFAGQGGSYLQTSREPVLTESDVRERLVAVLNQHGIENIVLLGGNGTLTHIPLVLESWGTPVIGIPTTIDNDVAGTERTLGFDSACNYAYHALDGVLATARALPGRIFMVETLGGTTGYLALDIAAGAGAHLVLIPEYTYDDDWLVDRLKSAIAQDGYALGVISEGVQTIADLHELIPRCAGTRLRYIKLGHAQRGGLVTHVDRRLAFDMARLASAHFRASDKSGTLLIKDGQLNFHTGGISDYDRSPPDRGLYNFINGLG